MMIHRYIALTFFKASGLVLLLLLTLFSFLSLTETLEDVGKGAFTTVDAISIVLLTLPTRALELLPVTTVLGAMLGLGLMANHRELVAMRAAGMSIWQMSLGLLAAAAILIGGAAALQLFLAPLAEREAQEFRTRTLDQTSSGGAEFWSRRDRQIVRVGHVAFGSIPQDIEIFTLDANEQLVALITASKADVISAETWLLHDAVEKRLTAESVRVRRTDQLQWRSILTADQLATLIAPPNSLGPLDLYRYLNETSDSDVDTRPHQVLFWRQVSLPFAILGMMLVALPLIISTIRARSAGFRIVLGGAIGIGFYLFEQTASHISLLYDLAPAATALAPAALIIATALIAISRLP